MSSQTSLGRVQPIYQGIYDENTTYYRLDNVYYEGDTWVCKNDGTTGVTPVEGNYWQKVASKGDTGSFGTPIATAYDLEYGEDPTATVTASGPDSAKIFTFNFGIPAGPVGETGVQSVNVSATGKTQDGTADLAAGDDPWATASLDSETQALTLAFGIPPGHDGSGAVSKVDSIEPTNGNVALNALRYTVAQSLSEAQKTLVLGNIGAQAAGDYITEPSSVSTGQFLYYDNSGEWAATSINLVPSGSSSDVGKYLRKSSNGMIWADVQSLPSGGSEGMPLIKNSGDNYDVTWGTFISTSDIDDIIDA